MQIHIPEACQCVKRHGLDMATSNQQGNALPGTALGFARERQLLGK